MSYIEKINGPHDLKKLKIDEMKVLAGEIRDAILRFKEDDDFRLKIAQKAKADAQNFTIEKRAEKILDFMNGFIKD